MQIGDVQILNGRKEKEKEN